MPPETDNLKLQELFDADQAERQKVYGTREAVKELGHRDAMRRKVVAQMMQAGEVSTTLDLYRAAVIFQHGETAKDFLTAHRLASLSALNGHRPARWLMAATLDRFLMAVGQPQVYGTQFEHDPETNKYQLRLPMDEAGVLSFEKQALGVPAVAERLEQLNGKIKAS